MNHLHPFKPSSRDSRQRIRPSTVVEMGVGGQLKRYQLVQYRSPKKGKAPEKRTELASH